MKTQHAWSFTWEATDTLWIPARTAFLHVPTALERALRQGQKFEQKHNTTLRMRRCGRDENLGPHDAIQFLKDLQDIDLEDPDGIARVTIYSLDIEPLKTR